MTPRSDRQLDLVVFGATSFVGQILCRHLVERHGVDGPLRWAIAGRDPAKLDGVAADTGADVERIIADATDLRTLRDMASRTRVVVSTVGPYALHGSVVVRAVAEEGTGYCDLAGEPQWIGRMIDTYSDIAERSGARIVPACGFDSIPSDLGVWFTQRSALESFGRPCNRVSMRLVAMRGGASGGTIASILNLVGEAVGDAEVRSVLTNPYALCPPGERSGVNQHEVMVPIRDGRSGQWVTPFVMAAINTRIVHRTHALVGGRWGSDFRYDEGMLMGSGPLGAARAGGLSLGMAAGASAMAIGPFRRFLGSRVLPRPGTGPSPEAQRQGFFDIRFHGTTADGDRIDTRVSGDRDPGYGCTARMLGETAYALVQLGEGDGTGDRAAAAGVPAGGFWTPAALFGDDLINRLEEHAGVRFTVLGN